jgi:hypothetical protein
MIDELVTALNEHVDADVAVAPARAKRSVLVVASPTSLTPTSGSCAGSSPPASRSLTPFAMRRCWRLLQLTAAISDAETNWSSS